MAALDKKTETGPVAALKTARLKLNNGWVADIALSDSEKNHFTPDQWTQALSNPAELLENPQKVLKSDEKTTVILKNIKIGNTTKAVVIKQRHAGSGLINLCRAILPAKSIRNFRTAAKLRRNNIPTAHPLAAIRQKKFLFTTGSIYITDYIQNSTNLHDFIANHIPKNSRQSACKKQLSNQIAGVLASLHKADLWHRDAKAGNFLVHFPSRPPTGKYEISLVDMDGIKPYRINRSRCRFRCLAKLAATLLWSRKITRTDYLRTFTIYCNLTALDKNIRSPILRRLTSQAVAIRLLTMANSAMQSKTSTMKTKTPRRILIIKPSALGDVVMALPALSSLRKSFPDAHITWFIRPEFAPLLEENKNLDEIIIFDRKLLGKWWLRPKAFVALLRLIRKLRSGKFDLVIDLQGLFRTALFAWFTGCKKRVGMQTAREFATGFYTQKIPQDSASIHVIDYYQKIAAAAGAATISDDYNLAPSPQAVESVNELLAERNLAGRKYAVLIPGSAHAYKCWPEENFARLAEKVASQFNLDIVAVGTTNEKTITENINSLANVHVINMAGKTDIPQLIALLNGAEIVISNDTGPGHIAVALGAAIVMIFGPTNPVRLSPYNKPHAIAAVDSYDRPHKIKSNDPSYRIEAISVDEVFRKVVVQLTAARQ